MTELIYSVFAILILIAIYAIYDQISEHNEILEERKKFLSKLKK